MQERSGAKILVRGKGSTKDGVGTGHPDDNDELHVSIEGTEEAIAKAEIEVNRILHDPQSASQLKAAQLQNLAELNGVSSAAVQVASIYGPGSSTEGAESLELNIPNNLVGLIIGKGGENIQRMQIQTGAHVQVEIFP